MTDEDKEWLGKAMEQYTFDDADRLKTIVKEMQEDQAKEFGEATKQGAALHDQLEELQELLEIHERNSLNLCLVDGM